MATDNVSYKDFSAKLKAKYPEYKDVDDKLLAEKFVAKYPEYKDRVVFESTPSALAKAMSERASLSKKSGYEQIDEQGDPLATTGAALFPRTASAVVGGKTPVQAGVGAVLDALSLPGRAISTGVQGANAALRGDQTFDAGRTLARTGQEAPANGKKQSTGEFWDAMARAPENVIMPGAGRAALSLATKTLGKAAPRVAEAAAKALAGPVRDVAGKMTTGTLGQRMTAGAVEGVGAGVAADVVQKAGRSSKGEDIGAGGEASMTGMNIGLGGVAGGALPALGAGLGKVVATPAKNLWQKAKGAWDRQFGPKAPVAGEAPELLPARSLHEEVHSTQAPEEGAPDVLEERVNDIISAAKESQAAGEQIADEGGISGIFRGHFDERNRSAAKYNSLGLENHHLIADKDKAILELPESGFTPRQEDYVRAAKGEYGEASPTDMVGSVGTQALGAVKRLQSSVGAGMKAMEDAASEQGVMIPVQPALEAADALLAREAGLVFDEGLGQYISMPQAMGGGVRPSRFSDAETGRLAKGAMSLRASNGFLTVDEARNLEQQFNDMISDAINSRSRPDFTPADRVLGMVKGGLSAEINAAMDRGLSPEAAQRYMELRQTYGHLKDVWSQGDKLLGKEITEIGPDGLPVVYTSKGASLAKRLLFSNEDAGIKTWVRNVKALTGIDLRKEAVKAKVAMELFDDPRITNTFEGFRGMAALGKATSNPVSAALELGKGLMKGAFEDRNARAEALHRFDDFFHNPETGYWAKQGKRPVAPDMPSPITEPTYGDGRFPFPKKGDHVPYAEAKIPANGKEMLNELDQKAEAEQASQAALDDFNNYDPNRPDLWDTNPGEAWMKEAMDAHAEEIARLRQEYFDGEAKAREDYQQGLRKEFRKAVGFGDYTRFMDAGRPTTDKAKAAVQDLTEAINLHLSNYRTDLTGAYESPLYQYFKTTEVHPDDVVAAILEGGLRKDRRYGLLPGSGLSSEALGRQSLLGAAPGAVVGGKAGWDGSEDKPLRARLGATATGAVSGAVAGAGTALAMTRAGRAELARIHGGEGRAGLYAGAKAKNWDSVERKFSSMADKMPRFEIDDSGAKINTEKFMRYLGEPHSLHGGAVKDVLDHPKLFDNYPDIAEIPVDMTISPNALRGGSYEKSSGKITVTARSEAEAKEVLLHELQHAIQEREGFARGGSPDEMAREWNNARARLNFLEQEPGYKAGAELTDKVWEDALAGKMSPEDGDIALRNIEEEYPEYAEARKIVHQLSKGDELGYKAYKALAGEIEARDAAARMNMTEVERAATLPYSGQGVPLSEQIVRMGGDGRAKLAAPSQREMNKLLKSKRNQASALSESKQRRAAIKTLGDVLAEPLAGGDNLGDAAHVMPVFAPSAPSFRLGNRPLEEVIDDAEKFILGHSEVKDADGSVLKITHLGRNDKDVRSKAAHLVARESDRGRGDPEKVAFLNRIPETVGDYTFKGIQPKHGRQFYARKYKGGKIHVVIFDDGGEYVGQIIGDEKSMLPARRSNLLVTQFPISGKGFDGKITKVRLHK